MIQLNTPQKLNSAALVYSILKSVFVAIFLLVIAYMISQSPQLVQYKSLILAAAVIVAVLNPIYAALWWKLFQYTVGEDYIIIQKGVIFRSEKNINFNDIQSINAVFGPLMALFGLRQVSGFTSSPEQLVITSDKGGTRTTHVPDIQILLDKQTAEELLQAVRKGDVQKVQAVQ